MASLQAIRLVITNLRGELATQDTHKMVECSTGGNKPYFYVSPWWPIYITYSHTCPVTHAPTFSASRAASGVVRIDLLCLVHPVQPPGL